MRISKEKVELLMAKKCLTYGNLAKLSGVNQESITRAVRRGTAHPYTIGKIAKGLGVDVESIVELAI